MRKGFTMIELIFVIVILGILAAVAIPKLTATRDDAQIAKGASEVATAVQDMAAYYTAQGTLSTVSNMTNVDFADNTVDLNTTGNSVTYQANSSDCITITSSARSGNAGDPADQINVAYTSGVNGVCDGIATAAEQVTGATNTSSDHNKTHTFGGQGVSF